MMGRSRMHDQTSFSSRPSNSHHSRRNVFRLLSRRELCPQTKYVPKKRWGEAYKWGSDSCSRIKSEAVGDAKHDLVSWVEDESLRHLSAKYCSLVPPPRSTIAAAFSPDGRTLASTHGDHTVKIIDWQTASCLKVLSGHRRTPWVVRFHPLHPEILASGSLDHQVRLWDANSSECTRSHDFYRPIASIAFHAEGEILAVASGHKLYIWHYNKKGEASSPKIVLKTKRSLRAVHFHPHAAPFLLTAEVNDLDSSDSSMTLATSQGYLRYPPPAVFMANIRSSNHLNLASEVPLMSLPLLFLPSFAIDDSQIDLQQAYRHVGLNSIQVESSVAVQLQSTANAVEQYDCMESPMDTSPVIPSGSHPDLGDDSSNNFPNGVRNDNFDPTMDVMETSEMQPARESQHRRTDLQRSHFAVSESREGATSINTPPYDGNDVQPIISRIRSELATSLAAAELPCTVKLRIWTHDIKNSSAPLSIDRCRLTIPHAVLCSEMGAHFSPCGRFLAACVACMQPHMEADAGLQAHQDLGAGSSPTRHPISAHQVIYELRIYSLEEATFGSVLVSRAIRAAHCLTSIQFSPTSEHILLAYGRRHGSLLKSIVIDGETMSPVYTVLEVYRVSDMELVRVLPSSEDEVNVACFHPSAGGGLVYGTKEGKLRVLRYDSAHKDG